jgi:hypothetical protein
MKFMKMLKPFLIIYALSLFVFNFTAQAQNEFTPAQIKAIQLSCDSISGPG